MNKNIRIVYRKILKQLETKGYLNLNHRLVNSKDDLVEIAAIFRDLRYETFRLIYVNDKNKIVGNEAISTRIPNKAQVFYKFKDGRINVERSVYIIQNRMKRLNATRILYGT